MPKKILLIDDEASIRTFIRIILEKEGFEITEAVDGQDGVNKALELQPDLIILDLMMPNMPGGVAAGHIREHVETANTPIIFLTAVFDEEEAKIINNRFAGERLLTKPVDPLELVEMVKQTI